MKQWVDKHTASPGMTQLRVLSLDDVIFLCYQACVTNTAVVH